MPGVWPASSPLSGAFANFFQYAKFSRKREVVCTKERLFDIIKRFELILWEFEIVTSHDKNLICELFDIYLGCGDAFHDTITYEFAVRLERYSHFDENGHLIVEEKEWELIGEISEQSPDLCDFTYL